MKIAWFTPFHTQSAIGHVSLAVVSELSRRAEVDIWHPPADCLLQTSLRTISCPKGASVEPVALEEYDVVFYNLGDHLSNHLEIFKTSQLVPGVVILHDLVLHHFFVEYYLNHCTSPEAYLDRMEDHYGLEGVRAARASLEGVEPPIWNADRILEFPLFEDALIGSTAVVTHSEFARRRIEQSYAGPTKVLPLPYVPPPAVNSVSREKLGVEPQQRLVVTIGRANTNKRILECVEAMGTRSMALSNVVYAVLGDMDLGYRTQVIAAAERTGLAGRIHLFEEFVPDQILHDYLHHADLVVNLRSPTMEGGSASVLTAMLAGKAVLVSNAGCYAELPDACVRKVEENATSEELGAALQDLLDDDNARLRMGVEGRRYVLTQHSTERYCDGLLELADAIGNAIGLSEVRKVTLASLQSLGLAGRLNLSRRYEREAKLLFGVKDQHVRGFTRSGARSSDGALARLREASATIGEMPPSPPTLRGRIGAKLVLAVRRTIFWLIPQLQRLHTLLISFYEQQQGEISQLQASLEELREDSLERDAFTQASCDARIKDLEARIDLLSTSLSNVTQRREPESAAQEGAPVRDIDQVK